MENTSQINRRSALGLITGSLAMPLISKQAAAANVPVLVELFTSQGCSSCPPADKLAGQLRKMPGVTVVSLNVDYWDYLGWRDTLAKPEYTQRQYDYAKSMGESGVYTPQMVINGVAHVVGNGREKVETAIAKAQKSPALVGIELSATEREITVEIGAGVPTVEATLWLMAIAPEVKVGIERGENTGKDIIYHNAVKALVPAGMWTGEATTLKLPRKAIVTPDTGGIVAVLQQGKVGPVLGLARWGDIGA